MRDLCMLRALTTCLRVLALLLGVQLSGATAVMAQFGCDDHACTACCDACPLDREGRECPPSCPACHCAHGSSGTPLAHNFQAALQSPVDHGLRLTFAGDARGAPRSSATRGVYRPPRAAAASSDALQA